MLTLFSWLLIAHRMISKMYHYLLWCVLFVVLFFGGNLSTELVYNRFLNSLYVENKRIGFQYVSQLHIIRKVKAIIQVVCTISIFGNSFKAIDFFSGVERGYEKV
jgi:hypothetical protein